MRYFSILRSMKNNVRFEYVPWKNVWFYVVSIVWVHFSHKAEKFWFWKSLRYFMFFDKKGYAVRFEYVPWKNVWFCFISIVWVHFSIKLREFWFWKSRDPFFFRFKIWPDLNMSHEKMSDFVNFHCLGSLITFVIKQKFWF